LSVSSFERASSFEKNYNATRPTDTRTGKTGTVVGIDETRPSERRSGMRRERVRESSHNTSTSIRHLGKDTAIGKDR
jgi:hypothetical protein